jgi:hypothetical protein
MKVNTMDGDFIALIVAAVMPSVEGKGVSRGKTT